MHDTRASRLSVSVASVLVAVCRNGKPLFERQLRKLFFYLMLTMTFSSFFLCVIVGVQKSCRDLQMQ